MVHQRTCSVSVWWLDLVHLPLLLAQPTLAAAEATAVVALMSISVLLKLQLHWTCREALQECATLEDLVAMLRPPLRLHPEVPGVTLVGLGGGAGAAGQQH